jgi:hydrogenase maturation factor
MTGLPDPAGPCGAEHCVTCGDDGVPMQVVSEEAGDGLAACVDGDGRCVTVETTLVEGLVPGDTVLVHAGVALVRLAAEEAPA